MKRFTRFLTLSPREQLVLIEAALCLCLARLLLLIPFRRIVPLIGQPEPGTDRSIVVLSPEQHASALAIRDALLRAARALPWNSSCLASAIAGRLMLRWRHMPSVLQLGARGGPGTELSAHAWLRCGEIDVVGAKIAAEFTPLVAFRA
jgi:hypothetical protein